MVKNYVIDTPKRYVKTASIIKVDGIVKVKSASFTEDLQEARMFNEKEYEEDLKAWETFLGIKQGHDFAYIPAEKKIIRI